MKKFLSIILAVMMVLTSTVSYAAPSIAGLADSATEYVPEIEEPAVEDEAKEEASLLEEEAPFYIDCGAGKYEEFYLVIGSTVSSALEQLTQPGKTAVALLKEDGTLLKAEDAIALEPGVKYKALYNSSILKSWEFDDEASTTNIEVAMGNKSFENGLMITTRNATEGTYYVNFGPKGDLSGSLDLPAASIDDIVYRVKGPANVADGLFVYYVPGQKTAGIKFPFDETKFVDASLKEKLGKSVSEFLAANSCETLYGFRVQGNNQVLGTKVYYDFVRVLGKESTLVLKLNAGAYGAMYVDSLFPSKKVSDLLAYVNDNKNDSTRIAIALKRDGNQLSEDATLAEAGITDFSEIEIVWKETHKFWVSVKGETPIEVTSFFSEAKVSDVLKFVTEKYVAADDFFTAAGALRYGNTIYSADETVDSIPAGSTVKVIWSVYDDFGYNYDADTTITAHASTGLSAPTTEDGRTVRIFTKLNNNTDSFRMMLSGIKVPQNKLKYIYVTLKSNREEVYKKNFYWGGINQSSNTSYGFTSTKLGSSSVKIVDGEDTADKWYTIRYDAQMTSDAQTTGVSLYSSGISCIRYDFIDKSNTNDYVYVDDFRFVGEDVLPVLVVDMKEYGEVVVPYSATTTAAQVIEKVVEKVAAEAGISTDKIAINSIGGISGSETVYSIFDGKSGITTVEVKPITVNTNDNSENRITSAPNGQYYAVTDTIQDVLDDIVVSESYEGDLVIAGLSTAADGDLIRKDTVLEDVNVNTLYIIWREVAELITYEFNSADDLKKFSKKDSFFRSADFEFVDSETLDDAGLTSGGALKVTMTKDNSNNHSGDNFKAGDIDVRALKDFTFRAKFDDKHTTTPAAKIYPNAKTPALKDVAGVKDENGWYTFSIASQVSSISTANPLNSIQFNFLLEDGNAMSFTSGEFFYIDYVRYISKYPVYYVTIDEAGYSDTNETFKFSIVTTVSDIISKITPVDGKSPIAIVYNETVYEAGDTTKIVDIIGFNDDTFTMKYAADKKLTVTGLGALNDAELDNVYTKEGVASATTIGSIVEELNATLKENNYLGTLFVEGLTKTEGSRVALDESLMLSEVFTADATEAPLYAILDEMNIIVGWEFDGDTVPSGIRATSVSSLSVADGKLLVTKTAGKGGNNSYAAFSVDNIPTDDITDIVAYVKTPETFKSDYNFIYDFYTPTGADDHSNFDIPLAFTPTVDYQIIRLAPNVLPAGKLYGFRFLQESASNEEDIVYYEFVRVIGKPLPEVDVTDIPAEQGSFGEGVALTDVDYTKTMTFGDLVTKLEFTPFGDYRIVAFKVDGVEHKLNEVMSEVITTTDTVTVTPVLEERYEARYTVDFGVQTDFFSRYGTEAPILTVSETPKLLSDLEDLVVDEGDMKFVGLAESAEEALNPANKLDSNTVLDTLPEKNKTITYYAIWESYEDKINDLYSVEFTDNTGYVIGSTGKGSAYSITALKADGETYTYGMEDNELPPSSEFKSEFVSHDKDKGTITLKYDVSEYAKSQGENLCVWDSNIIISTLEGDAYIPKDKLESIVFRMKYTVPVGFEGGSYSYYENADVKGTNTLDITNYYAPHLHYLTDSPADIADYSDYYSSSNVSVASGSPYRNHWFTTTLDVSELNLILDGEPMNLHKFRIDPTDGMPHGSTLEIDFVRFLFKDSENKVDLDDVKSYADEANPDLASNIRVASSDADRNGVRVKGQYSYFLVNNNDNDVPYATDFGMMFASADRLTDSSLLTMDNYLDPDFNTSSLILAGYARKEGLNKVAPFDDLNDEEYIFSYILYNIPVKNYETDLHVRPFAKYAGAYIYGKPVTTSFMDIGRTVLANCGCAENVTCTDPHCVYIKQCLADYKQYNTDKKRAQDILDKFSSVLTPANLAANVVIPIGTNFSYTDTTAKFDAFKVSTGEVESITVSTVDTYPAVVKNNVLASTYLNRPCAIVTEDNKTYIMSLGFARDGESGAYKGINKSDTAILDSELETDASAMFIKNAFVPESPFMKIRRSAQTASDNDYVDYTSSYFLGDFSFGTYNYKTENWAGVKINLPKTGKTAAVTNNTKLVIRTIDTDDNSKWEVKDRTYLESSEFAVYSEIYFNSITYVVGNNLNNRPSEDEAINANCPMYTEDLVFLYGVIDKRSPMEKTYSPDDLPNIGAEGVTPIFSTFDNGFNMGGFESVLDDGGFGPEIDYFAVSADSYSNYNAFMAAKSEYETANKNKTYADADGDTNFADWSIAPLYTYDYYGVFDDIISQSPEYIDENNKYKFNTLYDDDYKQLRWDIMKRADDPNSAEDYFDMYYSKYQLIQDYTFADNKFFVEDEAGSKRIEFKTETINDKESNVLSMTLNNSKFFADADKPYNMWHSNSENTADRWHFWPHLLVEHNLSLQPVDVDDPVHSAGADRIFCEFDIKLSGYKEAFHTAEDGSDGGVASFLIYSYLSPKSKPGTLIWFGMNVADAASSDNEDTPNWRRDSGANTYMYCMPEHVVYGSYEKSLTSLIADASDNTESITSGWIHVKFDLTPHIDEAIRRATAEDAYGLGVTTKDDWFFKGVNIGFECRDNVDATFEIANFNFYSYNKPETTPAE